MIDIELEPVPAGFELLPTGLGFTDTLQPIYRRVQESIVSIGLVVGDQHRNTMGICHGGVIMTMADIAAANGINVARGTQGGTPTINLSLDFIAAGKLGQWLQADVTLVNLKRRFGFCSGVVTNSAGTVARFNGTFYLPDHEGMYKDDKLRGRMNMGKRP
jgi:uncharacterized protein (TIGR00369 family)